MSQAGHFSVYLTPETQQALLSMCGAGQSRTEVIEGLIRKAAGLPGIVKAPRKAPTPYKPACKYCGGKVSDRRRSYCDKPACYQRMLKDSAAVVLIRR